MNYSPESSAGVVCRIIAGMRFSTIFVDLDDTLYPSSTGLWEAIKDRIILYMDERMGLPKEEIEPLRHRLFHQYGTTLRGLQTEFQVDEKDYLFFVHDIPLEKYLVPDPGLRHMLEILPAHKMIFTNANAAHAERVIACMELEDVFDVIIDVYALKPYCKPMRESFELAMQIAGEDLSQHCALVDDLPLNTRMARQQGIFSVLVGEYEAGQDADAVIPSLIDLPSVL